MGAEQENQNKLVGKRVKLIMERFGLTQKELGIRIGYGGDNPDRAINNIIHGRRELPPKKRDKINDEFGLNPDFLLLRSEYMTKQDERKAAIGKMQHADYMFAAFIRHIAMTAGYTMKEADRESVADVSGPYLTFERDGEQEHFSLREVNDFIKEVTEHSRLGFEMMIDRKRRG